MGVLSWFCELAWFGVIRWWYA